MARILGQVPEKFSSLRVISLKYSLCVCKTTSYITSRTPIEVEAGMQNKKQKKPHDRLLQAIIGLRVLPLTDASLDLDGCWTNLDQQLWSKYVKNALVKPYSASGN